MDARPKHDVASFTAIQQDLVSLAAARLVPVLLALAEPENDNMRAALAMLGAWDHTMGRGSTEALIYMAWLRELMHVLFADELGDAFEDYWKIRTEPIHRALGARTQWCDDVTTSAEETCAEAVSRALRISLEFLAVTYGHDMDDWRWGEAHAVNMKSRILGEVPAVGSWFEIDMPSGGEKETIKAGGFDVANADRPFAQNHGAGYRAVYDLSANPSARSSSSAPASPATRCPPTTRTTPSPGATATTSPCSLIARGRRKRTPWGRWCCRPR